MGVYNEALSYEATEAEAKLAQQNAAHKARLHYRTNKQQI
ncbi:hypothetical protein CCACVL1_14917 [Corchorus capsularis]|uniref:Uncharacterized protein n=1 Tax=Corchorus capsularis TaxID=210143 RepID=A0A1R3I509_COCAP|nr:hypothetical protein CCACVL1_14917 [Corchorus capsularis]